MKKTNTASRLKEIMLKRGLKQVDILRLAEPYCKKYGVKMGRNDISQYVSGKVEPKQMKLTILAMALQVNEVWLMGFDVSPAYLMGWEEEESFPSIKKELIRSVESMSDSEIQLMLTIAKGIIEQRNK